MSVISILLSPLLPSVPEKQSHRGLNLLWQTAKSGKQVICNLLQSLLCAQFSCQKAATQHAHRSLSLLRLTVKVVVRGFLPSAYISDPGVEPYSMAPWLAFCLWRGKICSSKCLPGRRAISSCATQGISSPQLICHPYPWALSTFSLFLTLLWEKGFLPFAATQPPSPPSHSSELCICHILLLQLVQVVSLILRSSSQLFKC